MAALLSGLIMGPMVVNVIGDVMHSTTVAMVYVSYCVISAYGN